MLNDLTALPADALLGLTQLFNEDRRTRKIDLGVGVFRTADNETPVMEAVARAQERLHERETTKAYLPPEGAPGFGDAIRKLAFGDDFDRCAVVQTPGGCGALRVGAELLKRAGARTIAIGTPTWANHGPLLSASGLTISMIPYYDTLTGAVDFNAFHDAASRLGKTDTLLLHATCHNPTGADLTHNEIDSIIDLAERRGFTPFVDFAYHGFAEGLDEDGFMVRRMAERPPQFLVAYSCSKHFGLYRERTGALLMIGADAGRADAMRSHAVNIARTMYSMPPAHGGALVADILTTQDLNEIWRSELTSMRRAVDEGRRMLVATARDHQFGDRFDYIERQHGMFSLLPVNEAQVLTLREKHGVYIAGNGRANLCGVNAGNVEHLCEALADVLN